MKDTIKTKKRFAFFPVKLSDGRIIFWKKYKLTVTKSWHPSGLTVTKKYEWIP